MIDNIIRVTENAKSMSIRGGAGIPTVAHALIEKRVSECGDWDPIASTTFDVRDSARDSVTILVARFKFAGLLLSENRAIDSFAIAFAVAMRGF